MKWKGCNAGAQQSILQQPCQLKHTPGSALAPGRAILASQSLALQPLSAPSTSCHHCHLSLLTCSPWLQVVLLAITQSGYALTSAAVTSYQIIRVLRLVRFMSLLRRLYATALAASTALVPGLNVSPVPEHA